jgi:hypothetical protein
MAIRANLVIKVTNQWDVALHVFPANQEKAGSGLRGYLVYWIGVITDSSCPSRAFHRMALLFHFKGLSKICNRVCFHGS